MNKFDRWFEGFVYRLAQALILLLSVVIFGGVAGFIYTVLREAMR